MRARWLLHLWVLVLLTSCGGSRLEDYQEEGEALLRSMARDLAKVHSREELLAESEHLEKSYLRLVDLSIRAREYRDHQSKQSPLWNDGEAARLLRHQLNRLCRMEGGQDLLVRIQDPALQKLDSHHQIRSRRQSRRK